MRWGEQKAPHALLLEQVQVPLLPFGATGAAPEEDDVAGLLHGIFHLDDSHLERVARVEDNECNDAA